MRGSGGAERSLAALAPYLASSAELHILTFTGRDGLRGELETAGATLHDVGPGNRAAVVSRLGQAISQLKPDIVHTTLIDADLVGRVAAISRRTPVVSSLVNVNHGLGQLEGSPLRVAKHAGVWAADAATARLVVRFHALTEHVAATMSRRLGIPTGRIEVIPRGRDPEQLGRRTGARRVRARQSLGVDDSVPLVVAAARHEEQKGLDILIESMALLRAEVPGSRLLIGGRDGRHSAVLHSLVERHQLTETVSFIGQRDDLPELMCAADVWCVPSRWEGLGSILIEAMALEVPVVASDIPPIAEVAGTPSTFWLCPAGSPAALAATIVQVLGCHEEARRRTDAARERFLGYFTAEEISRRMLNFYMDARESSRLGVHA